MADASAFLGKANESLSSASDDLDAGRFNACARNAYYAAFQGAVAALMSEGIVPAGAWTHGFVQARFARNLVGSLKWFGRNQARAKADYSTVAKSRRGARRSLDQARSILGVMGAKLYGDS